MMKSKKYFVFVISLSLMFSVASALLAPIDCSPDVVKLTDSQWGVDSNGKPVVTVTFQGASPVQAIGEFKISPQNDYAIEHAYDIYVLNPTFMNGYSSDMFNTNSKYVGSNPHTMQIPYNPRNLPPPGTIVTVITAVYHDCHRDNDDSELTCTVCGWGIEMYAP
ncbi:unnamed protein product [Rhizophagus irregularis]|uniref:Secreted protein n=1 Tax=Rhizophagus irregularis TaxID=588596 RepID=A0A2I1GY18_9GLOM|nr:hypothetical protein RhiirA4_424504 [Rhizophagus irregularis]CAB4432015.1 unnamed protein product [Rhizophagus irregularis]